VRREKLSEGRFDDRYAPGRVFMKSYITSGSPEDLPMKGAIEIFEEFGVGLKVFLLRS